MKNLDKAVEFHGHLCPFVTVGTLISNFALKMLESERSEDEEIVCIAENNSCAIDAIQSITGCTLGKGNLIIKNYGKHVYIFGNRSTGKALRIYFNPEVFRGLSFKEKIEKARTLDESALSYKWIELEFPPKAEVRKSVKCDICGEYAKDTSITVRNGKKLCIPCSMKEKQD